VDDATRRDATRTTGRRCAVSSERRCSDGTTAVMMGRGSQRVGSASMTRRRRGVTKTTTMMAGCYTGETTTTTTTTVIRGVVGVHAA